MRRDHHDRFCIVGAGPSGLAAMAQFKQHDIAFDGFEREAGVGGVWNFEQASGSVYENTHFISSKRLSEYPDFPMPSEYPPFPHHRQALAYLQSYAKHHDLYSHIEFESRILNIELHDNLWRVEIEGEPAPRHYAGLVIANGHHHKPLWPQYPGEFAGEQIHAKKFKHVDQLKGKRVLVVGAGNSGCDIAAEAAGHADAAFISMRRGYHFLPKFMYGKPIDEAGERLLKWGVPLWLRRLIAWYGLRIAVGDPSRYGLPKPDHRLFETHPIINSQLLYHAGHGKIGVRPDIRKLHADEVEFTDGAREQVDLIVWATGYEITFPFLQNGAVPFVDGVPDLHLQFMHRTRDDFFIIGMVQPDSGLWPLSYFQAKLAARYIAGLRTDPPSVEWLTKQKEIATTANKGGIRYVGSPRHRLEVEHFSYKRQLQQIIQRLPDYLSVTSM